MIKKIINKLKAIRRKFLSLIELKKIVNSLDKKTTKRRIFLFQTPIHSNIGDHAISEAELKFLNDCNENIEVIEINDLFLELFILNYAKLINLSDLILLHGGGNFGNEYLPLEKTRRLVVETFPNNKIVILPQTIHYSKDPQGQKELEITKEIFAMHKNLILTAREKISYDLMKEYFPSNKVILTPDIVLYTSQLKPSERTYGLEVIRQDQESILSESDKIKVKKLLDSKFSKVVSSDMHVEGFRSVHSVEDRKQILEEKYAQFRGAKIVITDRLHGMVIATITGTPCIVFSNYNQKVLGTYEWIKDLEYIKFVNNIEEAKVAFNQLTTLTNYTVYDNELLKGKFAPLVEQLKN